MEELRLPGNIKIHYAGAENQRDFHTIMDLGVNYSLYTAYPFVERMVFGKGKSPLMPLKWQKDNPYKEIPQYIMDNMKHVIQDSGVFTLMYGSQSGMKDENMIYRWYDGLVQFTNEYSKGVTMVEIDCQKILNPQIAWDLREKLKNDCPNNRIINVFHLDDGKYGLDRLIEFSDYIAVASSELKRIGKINMIPNLVTYIKKKKPSIDIHILGCTDVRILRRCKFCTSADSTTWSDGIRFGFIDNRHISKIKTEEIIKLVGNEKYEEISKIPMKEYRKNFLILQISRLKKKMQKELGNQDYKF